MFDRSAIKLIMLDRDGVINKESSRYVRSVDEWIPIPGSLEAIAALNKAGKHVAVVTNQSGVARGYYTEETLLAMHDKMEHLLNTVNGHVDAIAYCPHHPNAKCPCRKPQPQMLLDHLQHFNTRPEQAIMVGDSIVDIQAALHASVQPALVKTGNGMKSSKAYPDIPLFDDLSAFVQWFLAP